MLDYQSWYIIAAPLYVVFLALSIYKKRRFTDILLHTIVFFYFVAILSLTIFPLPFQISLIEDSRQNSHLTNNFIPLGSILPILTQNNFLVTVRQIIGNVILFLPLGFFVPLVWKQQTNISLVLKIGFIFSIGIEVTQFLISLILGFTYKVTDVDDVILNTFGCLIGYFLFKIFERGYKKTG